jgi:hypothetical protein
MSEETVVRQAAPTLAGIKTGSMFPYRFESHEELIEDIRAFNRVLVPRGMCLLLLRVMERSALLYLYRPQSLAEDLKDSVSQEVLHNAGYSCESCAACVRRLIERFRSGEEFPHEVGLFLSYPPEDVKGFIDDRSNYKAMGLWKVYGDEEKARKLCERFQKCSECYCRLWQHGVCLEKLAVAV